MCLDNLVFVSFLARAQNWLTNNDEKSGILNWNLIGLKRLLSQGAFTESKTQHETEIEFQRVSDTISAFITEQGIFAKNLATLRADALEAYKDYCDINGLDTENEKKFTQRVKETKRISIGKINGKRAWRGISFKKVSEDGTEGTHGTAKGGNIPLSIFDNSKNINENIDVSQVSHVSPQIGESDFKGYTQLCCSFCGQSINDNNWLNDGFTGNKPCHKKCYDDVKAQLKGVS